LNITDKKIWIWIYRESGRKCVRKKERKKEIERGGEERERER
jgi:hypothetical protein